jgi:hypothetical protein
MDPADYRRTLKHDISRRDFRVGASLVFPRCGDDSLRDEPLELRRIDVLRPVRINQRHENNFLALRQVLQAGNQIAKLNNRFHQMYSKQKPLVQMQRACPFHAGDSSEAPWHAQQLTHRQAVADQDGAMAKMLSGEFRLSTPLEGEESPI